MVQQTPLVLRSSNMNQEINKLITYKEAAGQLDLSYYQLRKRASKGLLEAVKLPNGISALTKASIEAYLKQGKNE